MSVTQEQLSIITEFMATHGDISRLHPARRKKRKKLWHLLVHLLEQNGGPRKSLEKWMRTWGDLKFRVKKKVIAINKSKSSPNGKPAYRIPLSNIERRVLHIIRARAAITYGLNADAILDPETEINIKPEILENEDFHNYLDISSSDDDHEGLDPLTENIPDLSEEPDLIIPECELKIEPTPLNPLPGPSTPSERLTRIRKRRRQSLQDNSLKIVMDTFKHMERQRLRHEANRETRSRQAEERREARLIKLEERKEKRQEDWIRCHKNWMISHLETTRNIETMLKELIDSHKATDSKHKQ